MRSALTMMVGLAVFTAACGGKTDNTNTSTTGSSVTGSSATGGSTTGGATSGGTTTAATTTGGATTGLADGVTCTSNDACGSGICGIAGTGNCCASKCNAPPGSPCGAVACDTSGTCVYPVADAGAILCSGTCSNTAGFTGFFCDTAGACSVTTGVPEPCTGNYACFDTTSCKTTCTTISDCAKNFYCTGGQCLPQSKVGACSENNACTSLVCDISGVGDCCKNACAPTADPACGATTCNATSGACVYPDGGACGTPTCANGQESGGGVCDATGKCITNPQPCANNLGCNTAATACNTFCTTRADCAGGFYCNNDAGGCIPEIANGPCFEDDECTSGFCGLGGSGNCCTQKCLSADPLCGASACDVDTAACNYPPTSTTCGSIDASCAAGVEQPASACDGAGTCVASPAPKNCDPFICGTNACFNSCTDNSVCDTANGAFCDLTNGSCCGKMGNSLTVDSFVGSDATACCGYGNAGACATLTQAMKLIDAAQDANVTINAKVSGGAGDWKVKTEVYPVVLGWGVELNAPGVFFFDPNQSGARSLFDINFYSSNDALGYASIVGTAKKPVGIGQDTKNDATAQSNEATMVQVETGNTLYLANANLNSSWNYGNSAITVIGGGTLTLGQDQSAAVTGTVTIGNNVGNQTTDGWDGILCTNNGGNGCTITDATLTGISSLVIEGQEDLDIDAEDFATITLKSAPTIGIAPTVPGFLECPNAAANDNGGKPDTFSSGNYPFGAAVLLNGLVTMTFDNGFVQCISGYGFVLNGSSNGVPSLTLDNTTVQNTEWGLVANAGTAEVTSSTFQYNYNGVAQNNDGSDPDAIVNLDGGNTVICASAAESTVFQNSQSFGGGTPIPGVDVLNTTGTDLNADDSTWDTKTPDQFSCTDTSFSSCSCTVAACTDTAGDNGMDAVDTSSGTVTTTTPTLSKASCAVTCGKNTCTAAQICCPTSICQPQVCAASLDGCFQACEGF